MVKKIFLQLLRSIDRFHWLLLFAAAPFLLFPTPKRSLALLIVPIIWGSMIFGKPQEAKIQHSTGFPSSPLNISILVMVVMILVSTLVTYSIEQSLEKISGLVLGMGVFFALIRESRKPQGWWWCLVVFIGAGLSWSLLGFLGMNYQVRFSFLAPVISRIPIIFNGLPGAEAGLQHNAVGGTVVWFLPLFLALSVYSILDSRLKIDDWGIIKRFRLVPRKGLIECILRILLWLGTIFVTGLLVLTQSRGSYLALGVTIIGIFFIIMPNRLRWIFLLLVCLVIFILAVLIVRAGGWQGIVNQLGLSAEEGLSTRTLDIRLEIWPCAIKGIRDFPITGMGLNTFREVVHVLYPQVTYFQGVDIAHAHNEFLQTGLDLGLPGLIAFLSLYLTSFWMLVRLWQIAVFWEKEGSGNNPDLLQDSTFLKTLTLGLGGGLFAHLVFGMLDAITLGAKPGIFFWYLLGLIVGFYQLTVKIHNGKIIKDKDLRYMI